MSTHHSSKGSTVAFINGKVILPNKVLPQAGVICQDGKILKISRKPLDPPKGSEVVDLHGGFLSPGFVDIHVHGGAGVDFMDGSASAIRLACQAHARHGTTTLFPTTTTAAPEEILEVLHLCSLHRKSWAPWEGAAVAGVHLYGPYFAPDKSGCHDSHECRQPNAQEWERYFNTGIVRIATCAAELPNATEFYQAAKINRCLITCGHSNASWSEMANAYQEGMRHVDHFWCAMSSVASVRSRLGVPMQGSMLEFVLAHPNMSTEVIADGCHLAPELLQFAWQMKGSDRLCLVTDCNRALDMPPGEYHFGNNQKGPTFHSNGMVGLSASGGLASSIQGMDFMVRHMKSATSIPLHEIIKMASLTPAQRTGIARQVGSIEIGKRGDFVVLSPDLMVDRVFLAGEEFPRL